MSSSNSNSLKTSEMDLDLVNLVFLLEVESLALGADSSVPLEPSSILFFELDILSPYLKILRILTHKLFNTP